MSNIYDRYATKDLTYDDLRQLIAHIMVNNSTEQGSVEYPIVRYLYPEFDVRTGTFFGVMLSLANMPDETFRVGDSEEKLYERIIKFLGKKISGRTSTD